MSGFVHRRAGFWTAGIVNWHMQAAAVALGHQRFVNWAEVLVVGFLGIPVACLADILEPALSPRHRGFFHSVLVVLLCIVGFFAWCKYFDPSPGSRRLVASLGVAFLSHHFLDSLTPSGLPLCGL
ncbi:MAG: inner membrane protein [Verrucomicrobiota bacterium]|jgi:hypothetical protein